MSAIEQEVASQPRCGARRLGSRPATSCPPRHAPGRVGGGTSLYVAARTRLSGAAGLGETDAFPGVRVPDRPRVRRRACDLASGTTTEVLDVVAVVGERVPTVAITASPRARSPWRPGAR